MCHLELSMVIGTISVADVLEKLLLRLLVMVESATKARGSERLASRINHC